MSMKKVIVFDTRTVCTLLF